MEINDITIIGAGAIGLACAYSMGGIGKDMMVIEKNVSFGREASSRNSEVIHSGIYYPKDSLKSTACLRGRELLYDFLAKNNIAFRKTGKILLSTGASETEKITAIYKNAAECGVKGLRFLGIEELRNLEPDVRADEAVFCPDTGIFDTHGFMESMYAHSRAKDVRYAFGIEVIGIEKEKGQYNVRVREPGGEDFSFETRVLVNCAGLWSDKIAAMAGVDLDRAGFRIHFCKGQYFRIRDTKKFFISHLLYPPPTDISLGIHVTPDLSGGIRVGPDAFYTDSVDYSVDDGAKEKFCAEVAKYLPGIRPEDLMPDTAGIRPKLHGPDKKFADFVVSGSDMDGLINAIGIESPGLTASLAIAELIVKKIKDMCLF